MSMSFFDDANASAIDLREEIHAVIFGRVDVVPQGKQVIVRHLTDNKCICFNDTTGGSNRPNCPYCGGEGFLWSETLETVYIAHGVAPIYKPGIQGTGLFPQLNYGYTDPSKASIYCEWNVFPNYERFTISENPAYDSMYELKVDPNGNTIYPLVRSAKWRLFSVTPMFGDFGRVEYFECGAIKVNV